MARLLVAHNQFLRLDPHAIAEMKPYPPLGTVTLAAALRGRGHEVALFDATFAGGPADFAAMVDRVRPERVLIVPDDHSVPQKMCLAAHREAAFAMIAAARAHGPVAVSGPDANDRPAEYLAAGVEAVFRGEPDRSLIAWAEGTPAAELPGATVDERIPEPAPPQKDLSGLPAPAWDLLDLQAYARAWRDRHGYWEAPVSTTRGCPYRCNWCAKPIWGRAAIVRPVEPVVAEARELGRLGADRIWFTDDIFALKRPWLRKFREEVERVGGIPPYRCLSRADLLVRDGAVDDLAASGCAEVWMGAESGSQKVLDAMDKDQDVREIHEATRRLRAAGVRVGFFLQLGYLGERLDDVRETIAMVRALRPDEIGISVTYPLPGTPFYERVKDRMHATSWDGQMDNMLLFDGEYGQPFYRVAREVLRHEHALVQGLLAASRLATGRRGPLGRRRDARRALASLKHAAPLPLRHAQLRWHAWEAPDPSRGATRTPR